MDDPNANNEDVANMEPNPPLIHRGFSSWSLKRPSWNLERPLASTLSAEEWMGCTNSTDRIVFAYWAENKIMLFQRRDALSRDGRTTDKHQDL